MDAIEELRARHELELRGDVGLRAWWGRLTARIKVRPEVQQDWILVLDFAERAAADVAKNWAGGSANPASDPNVVTVAQALGCLDAAKKERNFASAWLHVNTADALLPLVAPQSDLDAVMNRLGAWDASLPTGPKKVLDKSGAVNRADSLVKLWHASTAAAQTSAAGPPPPPPAPGHAGGHGNPPPNPSSPPPTTEEVRKAMHELQQVRVQCWNEANHQIAFMGSLWLWAGLGVFIALAISVFIAERWVWINPNLEALRYHFVSAAFLGFFGGALSAFLQARKSIVAIPRYQLLAIYTLLRMLIGAAGSFVVVLAILAMPLGDLSAVVRDNIFAFLLVSIAAGFSERLFVDTLEKAAQNLSTVSTLETAPAAAKESQEAPTA